MTTYTPEVGNAPWRRFLGSVSSLPNTASIFVGRSTPKEWLLSIPPKDDMDPQPVGLTGWSTPQPFGTISPNYWLFVQLDTEELNGPAWCFSGSLGEEEWFVFSVLAGSNYLMAMALLLEGSEGKAWVWAQTYERFNLPGPCVFGSLPPLGCWSDTTEGGPLLSPPILVGPSVPSRRLKDAPSVKPHGFSYTSVFSYQFDPVSP